ncbi:hypothetical protein BG015_009017 [Linnemannia schmuckeri]|uniref:F-box domain-containing protein n=1 Tax=Linnemannia schmuckeri TaxID=64567 RepID=A0A9P5RWI3_9FUNG|nr:hypothetical protein BG015_009017 [Linnemannia schmuckeri]
MPPPPIDPLTFLDIVDNIVPHLLDLDKNVPVSLACAAQVCKSWNALYTPFLWCKIFIYSHILKMPDFRRQGIHVRQVDVASLKDPQMNHFAPFCNLVESLILWDCMTSVGKLISYVKSVESSLRRFELATVKVDAEKLVSAWVAPSNSATAGGVSGGGELTSASLEALPKALPHLESLHLSWVRIPKLAITSDSDRIQEMSESDAATDTVAEEEAGHDVLVLHNTPPLEVPTKITYLSIQGIEMDDRIMIQLISKTPRLATLLLSEAKHLTGNFLETLLVICPELKRLTIAVCDVIPTSAYTTFFQSAADADHRLQLEKLFLEQCNMNGQALYYLASSQADYFLDVTICLSDDRITDTGIKD